MNIKNLPGLILLGIGILCVVGTFLFESGFLSFSDLFSIAVLVFFVGVLIYSRGNHKLVGIVLLVYGLLLFIDENYHLTHWLYMELGIFIPEINEFFLPIIFIVLGLYSISIINRRKKRNQLLAEITRKSDKNENVNKSTPEPSAFSEAKKNENVDEVFQGEKKINYQAFDSEERVIFGQSYRKLNVEDEFSQGLSATVIFGAFRFDISRFTSFEKEYFIFKYLGIFGEIVVKVPENIRIKNDMQAYFSSFTDDRKQVSNYTNKKSIIFKGFLLFAKVRIVEF